MLLFASAAAFLCQSWPSLPLPYVCLPQQLQCTISDETHHSSCVLVSFSLHLDPRRSCSYHRCLLDPLPSLFRLPPRALAVPLPATLLPYRACYNSCTPSLRLTQKATRGTGRRGGPSRAASSRRLSAVSWLSFRCGAVTCMLVVVVMVVVVAFGDVGSLVALSCLVLVLS